jgi:uncharacterized protein YuzE
MKMTYDHKADALYITLTENVSINTRQMNPNFRLDVDENDEVVGIEVLNVRKSGIDPLSLTTIHHTPDHEAERPDPAAIKARRAEIRAARKRQQEREET